MFKKIFTKIFAEKLLVNFSPLDAKQYVDAIKSSKEIKKETEADKQKTAATKALEGFKALVDQIQNDASVDSSIKEAAKASLESLTSDLTNFDAQTFGAAVESAILQLLTALPLEQNFESGKAESPTSQEAEEIATDLFKDSNEQKIISGTANADKVRTRVDINKTPALSEALNFIITNKDNLDQFFTAESLTILSNENIAILSKLQNHKGNLESFLKQQKDLSTQSVIGGEGAVNILFALSRALPLANAAGLNTETPGENKVKIDIKLNQESASGKIQIVKPDLGDGAQEINPEDSNDLADAAQEAATALTGNPELEQQIAALQAALLESKQGNDNKNLKIAVSILSGAIVALLSGITLHYISKKRSLSPQAQKAVVDLTSKVITAAPESDAAKEAEKVKQALDANNKTLQEDDGKQKNTIENIQKSATEIDRLKNEITKLNQQIKQNQALFDTTNFEQDLQKQKIQLETKIAELEEKIKTTDTQNLTAEEKIILEESNKSLKEAKKLTTELEVERINAEIEKNKTLTQELEKIANSLERHQQLDDEIAKTQTDLEKIKTELESVRSQLNTDYIFPGTRERQLIADEKRLERELTAVEDKLKIAEEEKLNLGTETDLKEQKQQIEKGKNQLQADQTKLSSQLREQILDLDEKIKGIEEQKVEIEQKLAAPALSAEDKTKLESERTNLENSKQDLETQKTAIEEVRTKTATDPELAKIAAIDKVLSTEDVAKIKEVAEFKAQVEAELRTLELKVFEAQKTLLLGRPVDNDSPAQRKFEAARTHLTESVKETLELQQKIDQYNKLLRENGAKINPEGFKINVSSTEELDKRSLTSDPNLTAAEKALPAEFDKIKAQLESGIKSINADTQVATTQPEATKTAATPDTQITDQSKTVAPEDTKTHFEDLINPEGKALSADLKNEIRTKVEDLYDQRNEIENKLQALEAEYQKAVQELSKANTLSKKAQETPRDFKQRQAQALEAANKSMNEITEKTKASGIQSEIQLYDKIFNDTELTNGKPLSKYLDNSKFKITNVDVINTNRSGLSPSLSQNKKAISGESPIKENLTANEKNAKIAESEAEIKENAKKINQSFAEFNKNFNDLKSRRGVYKNLSKASNTSPLYLTAKLELATKLERDLSTNLQKFNQLGNRIFSLDSTKPLPEIKDLIDTKNLSKLDADTQNYLRNTIELKGLAPDGGNIKITDIGKLKGRGGYALLAAATLFGVFAIMQSTTSTTAHKT